jgi:hypothetical protein
MDTSRKNTCSYEGETYHHDAEFCADGKCMICKDGRWEETKDLFPPKESAILSP